MVSSICIMHDLHAASGAGAGSRQHWTHTSSLIKDVVVGHVQFLPVKLTLSQIYIPVAHQPAQAASPDLMTSAKTSGLDVGRGQRATSGQTLQLSPMQPAGSAHVLEAAARVA